MLEIILIYFLCKKLGKTARDKGHPATPYQVLLVLFWLCGEIGAAFFCGLLLAIVNGPNAEKYMFLAYLSALAGAAIGAGIAFAIVAFLPVLNKEDEDGPTSENDKLLEAIRADLRSGTPLQMARTKLADAGAEEGEVEKLVAAATEYKQRSCPSCNQSFHKSVTKCTSCGASLSEETGFYAR